MTPVVLFFQSSTSKSWRDKLSGAYRFASQVGWQIQVISCGEAMSEIRSALDLWKPIGCIVDRAMVNGKPPLRLFAGMPTVLLDQNPQTYGGRFSNVVHDSAADAELAARELLESDAKSFTYIPFQKRTFWSDQREEAFEATIRSAGREYVRWTGSFDALPKPCGILCVNDVTAQKAMAMANRLGWRIPEDLLVIGIDNDELICEHTNPTLTSILPDFEHGGYLVASLLKRILDGEKPIRCVYGPLQVVRRESSRWFAKTDPRVTRALAHIRQHAFETGLGTAEIVKAMGCSRRLADMRFREVTGRSIRDEIHALRMEKAFALLRNRNQSIGAIANLCGYASEPFFKRLFKRETGLSMRAWRQRQSDGHGA